MITEESEKHGGLMQSIKDATKLAREKQLLSCDPNVVEEIKEIMTLLGWHLQGQKPTPPSGMSLMGLPPISLVFGKTEEEPEIIESQEPFTPGKEKHIVIVINKQNRKPLEEKLQAAGWTMGKEMSYPFIGGVQAWTKTL